MISYERHAFPNHRQLDYLLNSFFGLNKNTLITGPFWESPVNDRFSSRKADDMKIRLIQTFDMISFYIFRDQIDQIATPIQRKVSIRLVNISKIFQK